MTQLRICRYTVYKTRVRSSPVPISLRSSDSSHVPKGCVGRQYCRFCVLSTDVSAGGTADEAGKLEEGSDIEVIATEHPDDVYFEDDPMELSLDGN